MSWKLNKIWGQRSRYHLFYKLNTSVAEFVCPITSLWASKPVGTGTAHLPRQIRFATKYKKYTN